MSASERMVYCKESTKLNPSKSDSSQTPAETSKSSSSSSVSSKMPSNLTTKPGSNLVLVRPALTKSSIKIIPFTNLSKPGKKSTKISPAITCNKVKPVSSLSMKATTLTSANKASLPQIVSNSGLTKINSNQSTQAEFCCVICEKKSEKSAVLVTCTGLCNGWFHVKCIKSEVIESGGSWTCEDCKTGSTT